MEHNSKERKEQAPDGAEPLRQAQKEDITMKHDGKERKEQATDGAQPLPQAQKEDQTLSLDELEAVSGGTRDWYLEGCAATVEEGSDCWGTDACSRFNVEYERFDATLKCPARPGRHIFETLSREPVYDADGRRFIKMIRRCYHCGTIVEALAQAGPLS